MSNYSEPGRPGHPGFEAQGAVRIAARVVGFLALGAGIVLIVIAFRDLMATGDTFAEPTKFWMFFVGMPLLFIGGVGLQIGFMGAAARYGAGETMPVVKDSAAYLTDGAGLLGIGRTVGGSDPVAGPYCSACGVRNDADAKFCDGCGQALG